MNEILEWIGAASGLICVYLTARRSLWCWPVGLISVMAYGCFFVRIQLYADSALQGFYLVTGILGWYHWARGGPDHGIAPIQVLNFRQRLWIGLMLFLWVPCVSFLLARYTSASYPFLDTLTASLSVAAQILLMRKFLDSWVLWIAVDLLSLFLYAAKEAYVTMVLYAIFLVMATAGWISWKRALDRGERV
jgi:nicotinamide mononucleotide transporter